VCCADKYYPSISIGTALYSTRGKPAMKNSVTYQKNVIFECELATFQELTSHSNILNSKCTVSQLE
jgi:hypothetical protein